MLDATAEEPVIGAVAFVPEEAVAEEPDPVDTPVAETLPVALPVVKDTWEDPVTEPTPVLVGRVVSVPLLTAVVVGGGLLPETVELESMTEGPVLVGSVVSVPLTEAIVVGTLADPVGVLEISIVVGTLPEPVGAMEMPIVVGILPVPLEPRRLDRMLPSPVESEVADEEAAGSVGVGVTRTPVDAGPMTPLDVPVSPPRSEERRSVEVGAVVDAAAEESTPVLGPEMPAVDVGVDGSGVDVAPRSLVKTDTILLTPRRSLAVDEDAGAVVEAAAEESTPVLGPETPAVDVGAVEGSLVDVGARAVETSDKILLRPRGSLPEDDEEAGAVDAAVPDPEMPDVMLSDVESELSVGLAVELDEVRTPSGPNVIPLPVEDAAEDGVVSGSAVVVEVVGRTITEGTDPEDAAAEARALERNDASGSLALSLELELDVAADGATIVV